MANIDDLLKNQIGKDYAYQLLLRTLFEITASMFNDSPKYKDAILKQLVAIAENDPMLDVPPAMQDDVRRVMTAVITGVVSNPGAGQH
jgi:hypothetical protein